MKARFILVPAAIFGVAAFVPAPTRAAKVCAYAMPAQMVSKAFSGDAKAGQAFRFTIVQGVTLDDGTVVSAGAAGFGIVRGASPAGRHNRDGMLSLEPRYIVAANAQGTPKRVDVTMNPTLPVAWTPSEPLLNKAASRVPLPIPGLVMTGVNAMRWGRNITLGPGFTFTVVPVGNLARGPVC